MKKLMMFIAIIVLTLNATASLSLSCTSFAVHSDKPLYGMNFDYPKTEIRMNWFQDNGVKGFYMEFQDGGNYLVCSGMNNKGLFIAAQIQSPSLPAKQDLEDDEIYIGELIGLIGRCGTAGEVRAHIEGKRLVPVEAPIHLMFTDTAGDSMIVEAGADRNYLITTEDEFMIMTNFRNSDFIGQPYDNVTGAGSYRYKAAYELIKENLDGFSIEDGWEALQKTVQESGYPTLCSTIFNPSDNEIYFALERDFERIWRISVEDGTIFSYRGFEQEYSIPVGEEGITVTEILAYEPGSYTAVQYGVQEPDEKLNTPLADSVSDESRDGAGVKKKSNSLVVSLLLTTLVLAALSVLPIIMISKGMKKKK